MKRIILIAQLILSSLALYAQKPMTVSVSQLPVINISSQVTLHIISPEKISYVDLSSTSLIGDLPEKNVLRIKIVADSLTSINSSNDAGIATIVGETYIAQYRLCFVKQKDYEIASSQVEIIPGFMRPLDVSGIGISQNDIKANALSLLKRRGHPLQKVSDFGLSISVNQIYTLGDYILIDLGFQNSSNLAFDVDELRFKIEDRKINKSTNVQSIELTPVFQLYTFESFKKSFRNIYAFRKATFPGDKVINVELSERQISGRNLRASIRFSDVLGADTF